ncbi:Vacuolar fusion protein mon1 [Pleurotus ostreatus]|uniref:Small ribosomal subunit protein mS41 n=1 Tax=Pleurotus ostreatus TaxID=5322 RepID=A0A8H7A2W5_PLEOS|nr:Vacuolar fusion protein mon1 [Pleurotus ostreatus]KAF7440983.1 Vacuolar fusion protein mon1 [Pleurotus ostreatus]
MSLHTLWSRWATNFSTFGRNLGSVRTFVNHAAERRVPPTRGESLGIKTPEDFLKAIGRSAETKLTVERWEDLWRLSGQDMKKAKLDVRDRRYILWCMEKYRLGLPISRFAHEAKPKKTIRGWGPAVQNGKRIRSRRIKP